MAHGGEEVERLLAASGCGGPRERYTEGWLDIVTRYNLRVIMICLEGYTSSSATAAVLQGIEGLQAWKVIGDSGRSRVAMGVPCTGRRGASTVETGK